MRSIGAIIHSVQKSTTCKAPVHTRSPTVGCNKTEVDFQCICQRCDPLRTAWVLANYHGLLPPTYMTLDPSCDQRFSVEIVYWLTKEALGGRSMKIDGDDMVYTGDREEIGYQSSGDGTPV